MIDSSFNRNAEDATYTEVKNLPANPWDVSRHPLAIMLEKNGKETPNYLAKAKEELTIDQELGLKNQAEITANEVLRKDVDDLTKSNNYYQVNRHMLEKLFKINTAKTKCLLHNICSVSKGIVWGLRYCALITLVLASSIILMVHYVPISDAVRGIHFADYMVVLGILSMLSSFIGIIAAGVATAENGLIKYNILKCNLSIDTLNRASIKLPLYAKLKALEAQRSKLFEDLVIAIPEVTYTEHQVKMSIDPAILGVTLDKRMYMVCYWDINKDIERTNESIKMLKKYKVSA